MVEWNWAFKTLMFSAFIPFVICRAPQIEAFIQTFLFSLGANIIPFGAKVMLSGGGYGRALGSGTAELGSWRGATLATISLVTIPLSIYLFKHSILMPKTFAIRSVYFGMIFAAILTTIGTYERTGLVGLAVTPRYMFMRSRRKLMFGILLALIAAAIAYKTSAAWNARIATLGDVTADLSALTRLLVWQWTFNYSLHIRSGVDLVLQDRSLALS